MMQIERDLLIYGSAAYLGSALSLFSTEGGKLSMRSPAKARRKEKDQDG